MAAQAAVTKPTPISASSRCGARRSSAQQQRAGQRRQHGGKLHAPAADRETERAGDDDTEPGELRDRKVNEDDAAPQHLTAQRHMARQHQQTGCERRQQNAGIDRSEAHGAATSRRVRVTSNRPNRSSVPGVPPTVNGSSTAAMPALSASHCDGPADM